MAEDKNQKKDEVVKTGNPLVFISHDTRDAKLAETFSTLLKRVSAGVLKSFRTSDKKGNQGIEYGVEWYPEIIKNIQNASDVVCLLTKRSVNRPWILFEAGMAFGRRADRTVLVEIGDLRPFSDVAGRHVVRLNNSTQRRQELAQRLETAGCAANLTGTDWHTAGDFDAALRIRPKRKYL